MILYQDTSSICKRYLTDEIGISETRAAMEIADVLSSSLVAFVETKGVLARALKGRRIRSNRAFQRISQEFDSDWADYYAISLSDQINEAAGQLATKHALTGVDAIHLASAIALRDRIADRVAFSTWDRELASAAEAEGFQLAHGVLA